MARFLATAAVLVLLVSACASGDSETTAEDIATSLEEEAATDESELNGEEEEIDEPNAPSAGASTLEELPDECLDLLAGFLREIEPAVSSLDWDTATMADMESLEGLDEAGNEFSANITANPECTNLDVQNQDFGQLIDFAQDRAPGTVAYLQFIDSTMNSLNSASDPEDEGSEGASCEDALAKYAELADVYASAQEAPIAELTSAQDGIMSCSAAQLAEFGETYGDFLAG